MLENQNIGTKLALGFGILTIIAVIIGVIAIFNTKTLSGSIHRIGNNTLPAVTGLLNIAEAHAAIEAAENELLCQKLTPEEFKESFETFEAGAAQAKKGEDMYEPQPKNTEEAKTWEEFKLAWKNWEDDHAEFAEMAKTYWHASERTEAAYEKLVHQALMQNTITFKKADEILNSLVEMNEKDAEEELTHADSVILSAEISIIASIVVGVLLAIILAIIITKGITRPVASMCASLERVADGDLTVNTGISQKDEIGRMADALDRTVNNLATVMQEIREAADQTAASGEELSASAQNISTGAQSQASTVEEISASIQELSKSIEQVAVNATDANQIAQRTTSTATEGRQSVDRSIDGMKAINDSSVQIAKIIGVINQIANQTNLLALNAAIEAASAGEHGLGFAVVADEVRKLAERSSQAAQEIAQLIDESGKRVTEGSNLSQEVGKSLQAILDGITRTTAGMAGISASTEEQSTTAKEVTKNVEGISAITEENSASAEEMAASAEELSAQAQRLQELVSRFHLSEETAKPVVRKTSVTKTAVQTQTVQPRKTATQTTPAKRKTATVHEAASDDQGVGKALYHE